MLLDRLFSARASSVRAELTLMWMYVALYSTYWGARTAADKMHDTSSKVDRGDIFIVHDQK